MKLFLLSIFITTLFGAEIDKFASSVGYQRDYNTALKLAQKQNKPLMLLVVADYCPWCKKFERKTLQNPKINSFIIKNFVAVVIDKNKDKGKYPKEFNTPLIPTTYFIDPNIQKSVHKAVAYMKKKEFQKNMYEALKLLNK